MSHKLIDGRLEIKNVAEEIYNFSTTANDFYIEINDIFELQYVVLLMTVKQIEILCHAFIKQFCLPVKPFNVYARRSYDLIAVIK